MFNLLKKHWPIISISIILAIIIGLNFHPGKMILGNDNFSPELDPKLTVIRSFLNPSWRDNRVLGIPSDSEQADVWRTLLFWVGSQLFPTWIISQGYIFLTLIIGVISMGKAVRIITNNSRTSEFFGSLLYLFSPITIWIYFYPVHLFVAAYAFTPLVLWMSLRCIHSPTRTNKLLLLLVSLLMGTTALTATMFITASLTIFSLTFIHLLTNRQTKTWFITLLIYLLPHLFWILPFATYVKSNSAALQNSAINREITASTIASEQSNNTWGNTLRFSTAWIDSKEDDLTYTYQARSWFRENPLGIKLGYTLAILATLGLLISLSKPRRYFSQILTGIIGLVGFILINGYNPPFSALYSLFDQHIPLFHQVFRWSSSKFWPLLLYPLIILAALALSKIIRFAKLRFFQLSLVLTFTVLIIYIAHPILSYRLIREEVFVSIPHVYSDLKTNLTDKLSTIDTTPHTNTRYFRKYDWGFWGSVFLNYLLPSPTTEKALVIGSDENQIAFDTLDQTYNSQDPDTYTSALSRYNITQILSDQSVKSDGLGLSYAYPFDWNLHSQMVTYNPHLTPTWKKDFLSLYQLSSPLSKTSFPLSPLHDPSILNKALAVTHNHDAYHNEDSGSIYPLALKASKISQGDFILNLETIISSSAEYQVNIPVSTLQNLPILAKRTDSLLTLSPYYPTILHNDTPIYSLPSSTVNIPDSPLTINNYIINATPTILDPAKPLDVKSWKDQNTTSLTPPATTLCNPDKNNPDGQDCYRTEFDTTKASTTTVKLSLNAPHPTLVDICLHSYLSNSCLNSPKTYIVNQEVKVITISSNVVVQAKDNIVVFIVAKTSDASSPNLIITNPTLIQHNNPQNIVYVPYIPTDIQNNLKLSPDDTLTTQLPITNLIPPFQAFHSFCPERGNNNKIVQESDSTSLTTTNCFDGLFSSFSLPSYLNITSLLTYANAKHIQGIPFEYNLKQDQVARKLATDLLPTGQNDFLNFTLLPQNNQNFTVELVNKGIGTNTTTNSLNRFTTIPIPSSWLSLALTPTISSSKTILTLNPYSDRYSTGTYLMKITDPDALYTLPTATSPYWRAVILQNKPSNFLSLYFQVLSRSAIRNKTLVNGYQDAWSVNSQDQGKYIAVIFFPNVLAYLGLILGLGLAFVLVAARQATKTASTHTGG